MQSGPITSNMVRMELKMKKKSLVVLLAISALAVSGCAKEKPMPAATVEAEKESGPQEKPKDTEQETAEAAEENGFSTGGGSPWIDSNLKNNITDSMVLSAKEDYHLYVNYDWLKKNDIPDGYSNVSPFQEVSQETMKRSQTLLEDTNVKGHDAELVQGLYRAFLDWDARNEQGVEPVMTTVKDIQGIKTLAELSDFICTPDRRMNASTFVHCTNDPDLNDATSYITCLEKDEFLLGDAAEYEIRTELGERYYLANKMAATALLTRVGYQKSEAEKLFDEVIDFEAKLAEVSMTSEDEMAPDMFLKVNNVMTMKEVAGISPDFPLERFIRDDGYGEAEKFTISEPAYFKRLNELYTKENIESIKGYILINYLLTMAPGLDREAYDIHIEKNNIIRGINGKLLDEEYAFQIVKSLLNEPLSRVYLEKYDAEKKKQNITEICEKVIDFYREQLKSQEWMSEETREKAVSKLDHIAIHSVYPDTWYDYSSLSLEGLSYTDCLNEIARLEKERDLSHINQKTDRNEWGVDILEANAYYNPQDNSINILLGILGSEFYQEDVTKEELYGGIGTVIGHEISHAFDTVGAQFDESGNLANWWKEEDFAAFKERTDKLVKFYDTIIPFEGTAVSGKNVQTEAIADMAGMKCLLALAEEETDFDYDVFFRRFAAVWRRLSSREFEYYCLTQDTHPLHYLRTNVTLQQFDEFFDTYDIKPGDTMYLAPDERILVW